MRLQFGKSLFWPSRRATQIVSKEISGMRANSIHSNFVAIYTYSVTLLVVIGYTGFNALQHGFTLQLLNNLFIVALNLIGLACHVFKFERKAEHSLPFLFLFSTQLLNTYWMGLGPFLFLHLQFGQFYLLTTTRRAFTVVLPMCVVGVWCLYAHCGYSLGELDIRAIIAMILSFVALHLGSGLFTNGLYQLIESRKKAEDLEQRKQYISLATHELRTPLAQVRQSLFASGLMGRHPKLFRSLDQGLEHLNWIISRVVDYQNVRDEQLDTHPTARSLREYFGQIQRDFSPHAEQKSIQLSIDISDTCPAQLILDWGMLRKAIRCLVENAIEHNRSKGFVRLLVQPRGSRQLVIEIEDSAGGFNKKNLHRLFQAYNGERLSDDSNWKGLGLGLYMAQQYIDTLEGSLTVLKTGFGGTTFQVRIPVALPEPEEQVSSPASAHAPDTLAYIMNSPMCSESSITWGKTNHAGSHLEPEYEDRAGTDRARAHTAIEKPLALLVDDSEIILMTMSETLKQCGFTVHTAHSGEVALHQCLQMMNRSQKPQLVLMDLQMPGMDGFECTRRLRELFTDNPPKFVAFTASTYSEFSQEIQDSRFDGFYQKGESVQTLMRTLEQLFPDLSTSAQAFAGTARYASGLEQFTLRKNKSKPHVPRGHFAVQN